MPKTYDPDMSSDNATSTGVNFQKCGPTTRSITDNEIRAWHRNRSLRTRGPKAVRTMAKMSSTRTCYLRSGLMQWPQSGRDLKGRFFSIAAISCLSGSDDIADIETKQLVRWLHANLEGV